MSTFIESLEEMAKKDTRVRAVLKRSLAFDPGTYPPAFPYVEYRLGEKDGNWKRSVYYLTAGLWANHRSAEQNRPQNLAAACGEFFSNNDRSPSIEKRFIALLDADEGQLAHRLRQMVALLKEYSVDFDTLREDLLSWNHPEKFVQIRWARAFYRSTSDSSRETETTNAKESQ